MPCFICGRYVIFNSCFFTWDKFGAELTFVNVLLGKGAKNKVFGRIVNKKLIAFWNTCLFECEVDGKPYRCGIEAKQYLKAFVKGQAVEKNFVLLTFE